MGLREQKKEEMRRRLYETATALFREKGFDGTRVKDVIDVVGVSEATFFNYFPTKAAVLLESELEWRGLYGAYLRELVERSGETVADRLRELMRVFAVVFSTESEFMGEVIAGTGLFFGSTGRAMEMNMENFAILAEIIGQGHATGEIDPSRDTMQLAEILTGSYLLTITNWIAGWWGDVGGLEPRLLRVVDVVLGGCLLSS
jgi:TetR/AcrR family transcriptional regulator, cholesterol catabolism regulator